MSEATDIAHRALAICRNYPSHVAQRQQAQILKQLAEAVIDLDRRHEDLTLSAREAIEWLEDGEMGKRLVEKSYYLLRLKAEASPPSNTASQGESQ